MQYRASMSSPAASWKSLPCIVFMSGATLLSAACMSSQRRGLAGTLLVHKILGAMAREGKPLMEIKQVGEAILRGLGTAGAALSPCHVPGRGASFNLEPETYGFGACGE